MYHFKIIQHNEEFFFSGLFFFFSSFRLTYSRRVPGSHGRVPAVVAPAPLNGTVHHDGLNGFFTSPSPIVPAHPFLTRAQVEIVPTRPLFSELDSDGYPSCSRDWCSLDRIAHNTGCLGV